MAGQDGVDVAELAPKPHGGRGQAWPPLSDVGGDPSGNGSAGGLSMAVGMGAMMAGVAVGA